MISIELHRQIGHMYHFLSSTPDETSFNIQLNFMLIFFFSRKTSNEVQSMLVNSNIFLMLYFKFKKIKEKFKKKYNQILYSYSYSYMSICFFCFTFLKTHEWLYSFSVLSSHELCEYIFIWSLQSSITSLYFYTFYFTFLDISHIWQWSLVHSVCRLIFVYREPKLCFCDSEPYHTK